MKNMKYFEKFDKFCSSMRSGGCFLVVQDKKGKPNAMTIGWSMIGPVWSQPMLAVLVRPSRYTYKLIEKTGHFSVNVPINKLKKELALCGTKSGRDTDKITTCNLKVGRGKVKGISILKDCDLAYECEIVHKTKVLKQTLAEDLRKRYYPKGNFHIIYFGRILHAYKP
ncbi:flavin reductase family protein [Elusimicrobiota bacterium]